MNEKKGELRLRGLGVSDGIGYAPALLYNPELLPVPTGSCENIQQEQQTFLAACRSVKAQLLCNSEKAALAADKKAAEIFEAHIEILEDEDTVVAPVCEQIASKTCTAAQAVDEQFRALEELMRGAPDPYMQQRAGDFSDLREQLLRVLLNCPKPDISSLQADVILVAQQLTPSDTIRMDFAHIAGILCADGSRTSHSAILARSMGIPAIVGCAKLMERVKDGEPLLIDGSSGEAVLWPEEETIAVFSDKRNILSARKQALEAYRTREACTKDGTVVKVEANVASAAEVEHAIACGADGIGLFRSEFLYMDRAELPSEEEQFAIYRAALEAAQNRPVTIRTLDIGGDKSAAVLQIPPEENPFLGYRAIRICLNDPQLFKTQLRALYRASVYGTLRIMFPMISSIEELRAAKELAAQAREELTHEGLAFNPQVPLGMMIEVPAAAVLADIFAQETDFFSIGTNDLIQYTVAVDRGNKQIEKLYDYHHPAVLRLIAHTIASAAAAGIPCCMCGEAAGEEDFTQALLGCGLMQFSVSAGAVAGLKKRICDSSRDAAKSLFAQLEAMKTAEEITRKLSQRGEDA